MFAPLCSAPQGLPPGGGFFSNRSCYTPVYGSWRPVTQRFMNAVVVINIHRLYHSAPSRLFRCEADIEEILLLENAVDPFRECVLIAVKFLGHAAGHPSLFQGLPVRMATVLASAVRVVDWMLAFIEIFACHAQGVQTSICFQTLTNVVTDDLTRNHVGEERKVQKTLLCADKGDIPHPDLVGGARL